MLSLNVYDLQRLKLQPYFIFILQLVYIAFMVYCFYDGMTEDYSKSHTKVNEFETFQCVINFVYECGVRPPLIQRTKFVNMCHAKVLKFNAVFTNIVSLNGFNFSLFVLIMTSHITNLHTHYYLHSIHSMLEGGERVQRNHRQLSQSMHFVFSNNLILHYFTRSLHQYPHFSI